MSAVNLLNVVVPCYNPSKGWEDNLQQKFEAFKAEVPQFQCVLTLVIDGVSTHTQKSNLAYLKKLLPQATVVEGHTNHGKGHALRQGVKEVKEGLIIFTDIDFPYTIDSMTRVVHQLQQADVVLGFRDQSYYEKVPPFRIALSKFLRWMLKNVLQLAVTDTQCGLKAFNQKGKKYFLQTQINRFLFDLEFVRLSSKAPDVKVQSVLVHLRPNITFSKVDLKIIAVEALNFLRLLTVLK